MIDLATCACGEVEVARGTTKLVLGVFHSDTTPCYYHKIPEYSCNRCMDTGYVATYPTKVACPDCADPSKRNKMSDPNPPILPYPPVLRYTGPELIKGKPGDAGIDLPAAQDTHIEQKSWGMVPIEVSVELPTGHWGWIVGRSSTFWNKRLMVNPGIIDNGYRGELFVAVHNLGSQDYTVQEGERLAQMILMPLCEPVLQYITPVEFSLDTERGATGFGSTG